MHMGVDQAWHQGVTAAIDDIHLDLDLFTLATRLNGLEGVGIQTFGRKLCPFNTAGLNVKFISA